MSTLKITELDQGQDLDAEAMKEVSGGLNAVIDNRQQANQAVAGGYGPIVAVNSPISAPVTHLTESNPFTSVNLNQVNLIDSHQNGMLGEFNLPR